MESMHAKEECKRLRANVAESRDKLADLDAKVSSSQRIFHFFSSCVCFVLLNLLLMSDHRLNSFMFMYTVVRNKRTMSAMRDIAKR